MSGYLYSECIVCGKKFDDGYRNYDVPKHNCLNRLVKPTERRQKKLKTPRTNEYQNDEPAINFDL